LGATAQILAGLEGLDAHAAAVTIRLAALERGAAAAGSGETAAPCGGPARRQDVRS
jgi:hypothetical protein